MVIWIKFPFHLVRRIVSCSLVFGRYIFVWKEELYPVGVGAFPFMEALGLRIETIGSVWATVHFGLARGHRIFLMNCSKTAVLYIETAALSP